MVTTGAVLHGDREHLLGFDPVESPLALQLAGDDPDALAACARIAEAMGYDEVNLNAGCPSERVRKGSFGVCLMERPADVARMVAAMREACSLPVTVKHRVGVQGRDRYQDLRAFVDVVVDAGADRLVIHGRSALPNLSPEHNRKLPPLRREEVLRLRRERPEPRIEWNGEVRDLDEVERTLADFTGVMIGRQAYVRPWLFAEADRRIFHEDVPLPERRAVVEAMAHYAEAHLSRGRRLHDITRHMLGLFAGEPGARAWRRALSQAGQTRNAGPELLLGALEARESDPGRFS